MPKLRFTAAIPLDIECPETMIPPVRYVLEGEYESHHDGHGLEILDIGANVGSFALWAERRWPGSRIHSYEPNPGTFAFLKRNTAASTNIQCNNLAVYPGEAKRLPFFSRFDGDGEAGLATYATDTFENRVVTAKIEVDVVHPGDLPRGDIVKIDIEGGEADVLEHLDLSRTSLVLAEFQNGKARARMQAVLAAEFVAITDEACPWDPILDYMDYKRELIGDVYGRMFYARKGQTRLTHRPPEKG